MSIVEFEEAQSSLSDDGNDSIINSGYSYMHPVTRICTATVAEWLDIHSKYLRSGVPIPAKRNC